MRDKTFIHKKSYFQLETQVANIMEFSLKITVFSIPFYSAHMEGISGSPGNIFIFFGFEPQPQLCFRPAKKELLVKNWRDFIKEKNHIICIHFYTIFFNKQLKYLCRPISDLIFAYFFDQKISWKFFFQYESKID